MKQLKFIMEENRKEEFRAVCRFIERADLEYIAKMIEEIRCVHNNLIAFDVMNSRMSKIESICINGECVQLTLEK